MLNEVKISSIEIEKLYHWRNGMIHDSTKYIGEFDFCSQGKMLPLQDAIRHYKTYVEDRIWRENLFPIITTYGGDYLLLDVDKDSKTYGVLFLYSPNLLLVEPLPAYDNIGTFFETVVECYVWEYTSTTTLQIH
jgi:hypothetical protein